MHHDARMHVANDKRYNSYSSSKGKHVIYIHSPLTFDTCFLSFPSYLGVTPSLSLFLFLSFFLSFFLSVFLSFFLSFFLPLPLSISLSLSLIYIYIIIYNYISLSLHTLYICHIYLPVFPLLVPPRSNVAPVPSGFRCEALARLDTSALAAGDGALWWMDLRMERWSRWVPWNDGCRILRKNVLMGNHGLLIFLIGYFIPPIVSNSHFIWYLNGTLPIMSLRVINPGLTWFYWGMLVIIYWGVPCLQTKPSDVREKWTYGLRL